MATRKSSRIAAKSKPPKLSRTPEYGGLLGMQCSICLGDIAFRGRLSVCKHKFCYTCILEWSKNTNTCPLCKKRFRCITRVCLCRRTPPRQVRVADRDGHEDDHEEDDDGTTSDNIRESTIIDYLSCLTPHPWSNGMALNEYDYNDSFIDDSQLSNTDTPQHIDNMLYSSPIALNVGRTGRGRRKAYLPDSDSDTTPQSTGRHVSELTLHDDNRVVNISYDSSEIEIIPDTPERHRLNKSPGLVRKKTNGNSSHSKGQWLTTRKRRRHQHFGRKLKFYQ